MRARVKVCLEARYLVLSRGFRSAAGEVMDPFDEMRLAAVAFGALEECGLVDGDAVDSLAASMSDDGSHGAAGHASAEFRSGVREAFGMLGPSTPQELSIFESVLPSVEQVCLEHGLARRAMALQADRSVFERLRRDDHPRYRALSNRFHVLYQRAFFREHGVDAAMDYVNAVVAGWRKALRWHRRTVAAVDGRGGGDASGGAEG